MNLGRASETACLIALESSRRAASCATSRPGDAALGCTVGVALTCAGYELLSVAETNILAARSSRRHRCTFSVLLTIAVAVAIVVAIPIADFRLNRSRTVAGPGPIAETTPSLAIYIANGEARADADVVASSDAGAAGSHSTVCA